MTAPEVATVQTATFADNRTFEFTLSLLNGETSIDIRPDSIQDLVIEDTTMNWYVRGYVDITNPQGALEKSITNLQDSTRQTYTFRNDSRDFLFIRMFPNVFGQDDQREHIQDQFYTMQYKCVVYSVKDQPGTDEQTKVKRLYFTDWRYAVFTDYNNQFTTSTYLSGACAHYTDDDRKIPTGAAIRHLIEETLGDDAKFSANWNDGARKVDYCSPANNRSYDDLENLVDQHVSDDNTNNQPCILNLDRFTDVWSLVPIGTIFSYACTREEVNQSVKFLPGIYQTEQFIIGRDIGFEERDVVDPNMKTRIPTSGSLYFNYSYGQSSCIETYRFVEMRGDTNQSVLNTSPVHQYLSRDKSFNINMADSSAENLMKMMKISVLNNMAVDHTVKDDVPVSMNVDVDRFMNKTIEHIFSSGTSHYSVLASSRNKAIKKLILQSNAIEFTVPGETTRRANRFISVTHNKIEDTAYNDKVDGQYFTIGVIHRIKNNKYTNKIIAVKPYNFNQLFTSDAQVLQLLKPDQES